MREGEERYIGGGTSIGKASKREGKGVCREHEMIVLREEEAAWRLREGKYGKFKR